MLQRGIHSIAQNWQRSILDLVYPPHCVGCGVNGFHWCPQCHASLQLISKSICSNCGMPYAHPRTYCERCHEFPEALQVRSYAHYEGSLLRALVNLKYRPNQEIAKLMGSWLAELCKRNNWEGTLILAVPLGKMRMRQRGYNQAELIANGLAEEMEIPLENKVLKRTRETRSQVGLDPTDRFHNVQDAFDADSKVLNNQVVFLVDDLLTTGATLIACTRALMKAGVQRVFGLTVARA